MSHPSVRKYKYVTPVFGHGKQLLEVQRRCPKLQRIVYLGRHATMQQCCAVLRERWPAEATAFTPRQMLLNPPSTPSTRRRLEKSKYKGITPVRQRNGKTRWLVQRHYDTPRRRYDRQLEAARAVATSLGLPLEALKLRKAKLPVLGKRKLREIHGPAMKLYCNRKPGDGEDLEAHAKRSKTWRIVKQYPGVIPSFLMAKVSADRKDVIQSGLLFKCFYRIPTEATLNY